MAQHRFDFAKVHIFYKIGAEFAENICSICCFSLKIAKECLKLHFIRRNVRMICSSYLCTARTRQVFQRCSNVWVVFYIWLMVTTSTPFPGTLNIGVISLKPRCMQVIKELYTDKRFLTHGNFHLRRSVSCNLVCTLTYPHSNKRWLRLRFDLVFFRHDSG